MSRVQVIRPAGAGHETLYVLLVSLMIVVLAASVVLADTLVHVATSWYHVVVASVGTGAVCAVYPVTGA